MPGFGTLLGPFVAAAGVVLAVSWLVYGAVSTTWAVAAVTSGVVAAAWSGWRVAQDAGAGSKSAGAVASEGAGTDVESREGWSSGADPLADIQRAEDAGRKYAAECPACAQGFTGDPDTCPNCGAALRRRCRQCQTPVKLDWATCHECGTAVEA